MKQNIWVQYHKHKSWMRKTASFKNKICSRNHHKLMIAFITGVKVIDKISILFVDFLIHSDYIRV